MSPGVGKDIQLCMTTLNLYACKSPDQDIRPSVKWAVNLVTANGHFKYSKLKQEMFVKH